MLLRNLLLIVGITALLAGGVLAVLWVTAAPKRSSAAAPELREGILIAAHPIATGSLLRPDDLAWKEVPRADISPSNLVRGRVSQADYAGAVARRDFAAGEPLVGAAIVKRNERGFLAAVLVPGKRAISIAVDAPQSSSGLVLPGDHVDIILTQRVGDRTNGPGDMASETVLRDLRVIAVDQSLSALRQAATDVSVIGSSAAPKVPKTITLEVTEREAEMLSVAGELGKLELSVRALESHSSHSGQSDIPRQPTWAWDVSAAIDALRRQAQPAAVQAAQPVIAPPAAIKPTVKQPAETHIEVMHGSKTETR